MDDAHTCRGCRRLDNVYVGARVIQIPIPRQTFESIWLFADLMLQSMYLGLQNFV